MINWNLGDILDAIEPVLPPDAPALIHGDRIITWAEMSARSNNLARTLRQRGADDGAKVAFYMRNRPEYGELMAACFKGRLTHVNINYRYRPEEVFYIFNDSDSEVVVYSAEFRDCIVELKDRLDKVHTFVEIGDASEIAPFAQPYEDLVAAGDGSPLEIDRSPDDFLFIYTGGTTGMPKGVMWRHDDMRNAQLDAQKLLGPVPQTMEEMVSLVKQGELARITLPACPLMHGTGFITAIGTLMSGGALVTLSDASFDAGELWHAVDQHKVQSIAIVGDAFAKPMLRALDENPGRWDTSSLVSIISSGVMWSKEVKAGLCRHIPQVVLMDSFGASEGLGFGLSVTTAQGGTNTAKFAIGEFCDVFDEQDRKVEPGSGVPGFIARKGAIPTGYYKDPEKSAKTFKTIDGVRYSIPGDWCTVEADGSLTLLGRGSVCINTAGEKVYPEEVEEALKTHPAIADALVVGVPHEKWGQAVTAVVHLDKQALFDEDDVKKHVRGQLAGYKTPKAIHPTTAALRASNGKPDYAQAMKVADGSRTAA
ncbi:acyl-CoA synthetase [Pacificimonas flava]|uniref:Acyl-CoA synthetase n=2 Tax=Pacificimonas TaxID=1960290 RepID=A0A219B4P9_9SPHN|nr:MULTISPECIES: acyl-CoA synthetase [Pacificimonas]MBZ6377119.1 acyl-CoA synthetase [Pacificimonas aurantium]OWV33154.1 acyl-CoA synthetase [Pacificimonas flava]